MKHSFTFVCNGEEIAVTAERQGDTVTIERDGVSYTVALVPGAVPTDNSPSITSSSAHVTAVRADDPAPSAGKNEAENDVAGKNEAGGAGDVPAPMTGVIKEILVAPGDSVEEGEKLMIMEAMKMDIEVSAFNRGTVREVHVRQNDNVKEGQPLVLIG